MLRFSPLQTRTRTVHGRTQGAHGCFLGACALGVAGTQTWARVERGRISASVLLGMPGLAKGSNRRSASKTNGIDASQTHNNAKARVPL